MAIHGCLRFAKPLALAVLLTGICVNAEGQTVGLALTGAGAGTGVVTSDVGGVNCTITAGVTSGACSASVPLGTPLTLSAQPAFGSSFAGWDGDIGLRWGSAASMSVVRASHTATLLASGQILVAGGAYGGASGAPLAYLSSAERYDPSTNAWSTTASMSVARSSHTATLLASGRVLVTGGYNGGYLSSAEIYDPATGGWSSAGSMSVGRRHHTATLLASGRVLVAGGYNSGYLSGAEIYDPETNSWSSASSMSLARSSHTATLLTNGRVLVAGGINGLSPPDYLSSAQVYDPATNGWTSAGSMSTARRGHTATPLENGNVLVAGGYFDAGYPSPYVFPVSADVYDPGANAWSSAGSMSTGRSSHSATPLLGGKVLVAGGADSASYSLGGYKFHATAGAEIYDPGANAWGSAGSMSAVRTMHTATLAPDGSVVLTGGGDYVFDLPHSQHLEAVSSAEEYGIVAPDLPVTMDVARNVAARLIVASYAIAVTASPASGGTMSCTPNPVTHGGTSTCTATASAGAAFIGFSGNCSGLTCVLSNVTSASSVTATFATVPGAPIIGTATPGNGQATVVFAPPPFDGNSAIVAFTATASPGGLTGGCIAPCTSITVLGLTNGSTYTFTVTATNGRGTGPTSGVSNGVTPIGAPGVTSGSASALGSTTATLNGMVSSNGGSTAAGFEYGLDTGYGSVAVAAQSPLPPGASGATVSAVVAGLRCNTIYHFRAAGSNGGGTSYGDDVAFATSACTGNGHAPGFTSISSAANAVPSIVTLLQITCPVSGAVLVAGSGESTAGSTNPDPAFIGLAYSIARDSFATDNSNVVQSSALAVFDGDTNRDFLNVQRVDSCSPGATHTYFLTAYRTTPDTSTGSFVWNARLAASEPQSAPGSGFAAGITSIGSSANATPTIVSTLAVACPDAGVLLVTGSGESAAGSTNSGSAFIGLAYSIARDSFATDNSNVVQSSALAVFDGDANRDFLNVRRVDSCTPGLTNTYRLTAYRTTADTSAGSFVWNARLTASEPRSLPGSGFAAGAMAIGSAANTTPTIVTTLPVTCPDSGAVLIGGSGESTALSTHAGTAFIGLAYSIARDSFATDNSNVVQSSALAYFDGDANRDFLNVQRVDACTPGTTSSYALTAYRTTATTSPSSFVWNGRLDAIALP